jgi:hypothetical protein
MNNKAPTARELAAALGHKKLGRIQVCPPEERTWIDPDGKAIVFDSKHEMNWYLHFVSLEKCGSIRNLRRQVKYDLHAVTPNGMKVRLTTYRADIVCEDRQGRTCVYDPKGQRTARWKLIQHWMEVEHSVRVVEL